MRTETSKFKIGTVVDPLTKQNVVVDKYFSFEHRIFSPEGKVSEEDAKTAVESALTEAKDPWTYKELLVVLDAAEKGNAMAAQRQKELANYLSKQEDLTDAQKETIAFEAGVKAFMKATGKSEEVARQVLTASKG